MTRLALTNQVGGIPIKGTLQFWGVPAGLHMLLTWSNTEEHNTPLGTFCTCKTSVICYSRWGRMLLPLVCTCT